MNKKSAQCKLLVIQLYWVLMFFSRDLFDEVLQTVSGFFEGSSELSAVSKVDEPNLQKEKDLEYIHRLQNYLTRYIPLYIHILDKPEHARERTDFECLVLSQSTDGSNIDLKRLIGLKSKFEAMDRPETKYHKRIIPLQSVIEKYLRDYIKLQDQDKQTQQWALQSLQNLLWLKGCNQMHRYKDSFDDYVKLVDFQLQELINDEKMTHIVLQVNGVKPLGLDNAQGVKRKEEQPQEEDTGCVSSFLTCIGFRK